MTTLSSRQRRAERALTDTVTVTYATGNMTQDPSTGSETPEYAVRIASVPAEFKSDDVQPITEEVGGRTATAVRNTLKLPAMTAPLPRVGDKVTIDAVGPTSNPARVGLEYEVIGEPIGSHETALRLPVRRWTS